MPDVSSKSSGAGRLGGWKHYKMCHLYLSRICCRNLKPYVFLILELKQSKSGQSCNVSKFKLWMIFFITKSDINLLLFAQNDGFTNSTYYILHVDKAQIFTLVTTQFSKLTYFKSYLRWIDD